MAGPGGCGCVGGENPRQAHPTFPPPVTWYCRWLAVSSAVVAVQALSHFGDDFTLQPGLRHAFVLYGRDRVLAHPALIDNVVGLGPEKPLPGLAEVGDPLLATIWNEDREPLEQLKDFGGSLLGHRRNVDGEYVYYLYRVIGGNGPEQLYMGVYAT